MSTQPRVNLVIQSESLALLIAIVALYASGEGSWWLFAALFFVPDVGMLGYLRNEQIGAWGYNLVHTYSSPLVLLGLSLLLAVPIMTHIGLIWMAHIALDRTLGYGLKYRTGFKDTHLQRV